MRAVCSLLLVALAVSSSNAGQPPASVWVDAAGRPSRAATEALQILAHAYDDGLDPADYDVDRATDLSAAMVRYFQHLHIGRVDPRSIGFRLNVSADAHDFPRLLGDAIDADRLAQTARELVPASPQYRALRDELARYRALAASSPATSLPEPVKPVRPGDRYAGLVPLVRQLTLLGDFRDGDPRPTGVYDGAVVAGVERFQIRHGLQPDGVLGRQTMAALRVPLSWRVRQIELALERLRWLPHPGDARVIVLNIPMFRLWAWDGASAASAPAVAMDAIVGRAVKRQTPVFAEEMREVIFRPYWNIPTSILRQEVLPAIRRDPNYLQKEQMEIVRGAGDDARVVEVTPETLARLWQGSLRLRQRPGPHNALGPVRFDFPNEENVYMHGTPATALFARSRRDFSHGCVRVADPVALAEWVLHDRPEWDRHRILATIAGSQTIHVALPRPIQVILFYTTAAVVPEDGSLRFADDIYGHDARLDRALAARRDQARTRPVSTWTKSGAR